MIKSYYRISKSFGASMLNNWLFQGPETKATGREAEAAAAELADWRGAGEAQLQGENENVRDGNR